MMLSAATDLVGDMASSAAEGGPSLPAASDVGVETAEKTVAQQHPRRRQHEELERDGRLHRYGDTHTGEKPNDSAR
jgi:hypothetical protein